MEGDVMVALLLGEASADSTPVVAESSTFFLFFFFFFFFFFGVVSTPVVAETTPGPDYPQLGAFYGNKIMMSHDRAAL